MFPKLSSQTYCLVPTSDFNEYISSGAFKYKHSNSIYLIFREDIEWLSWINNDTTRTSLGTIKSYLLQLQEIYSKNIN